MARLQFQLEQRPNAEFMSPTRKVPFLKLQKNLIAEFSPIVEFVARKARFIKIVFFVILIIYLGR